MLLNILLSITPEATAVRYADVYDMSELAAASSKIVDGTVERIETRMVNGKIISRLHLEVTKTWVGARNTELYVDVLGGTLDGITMTVPGGPTFEEGESVLLFIDQHRIVGFGQGAYTIDGAEATRVAREGYQRIMMLSNHQRSYQTKNWPEVVSKLLFGQIMMTTGHSE